MGEGTRGELQGRPQGHGVHAPRQRATLLLLLLLWRGGRGATSGRPQVLQQQCRERVVATAGVCLRQTCCYCCRCLGCFLLIGGRMYAGRCSCLFPSLHPLHLSVPLPLGLLFPTPPTVPSAQSQSRTALQAPCRRSAPHAAPPTAASSSATIGSAAATAGSSAAHCTAIVAGALAAASVRRLTCLLCSRAALSVRPRSCQPLRAPLGSPQLVPPRSAQAAPQTAAQSTRPSLTHHH